jgi:tRNA threonylcarbamoyl adenosine modification protein YeaZ
MLLAFDTATETASLAIYDLDSAQLLAELTWQARRRHTQDLLATTQQLLAQHGLTPPALTALAVTTGPGSFTGVRVAIATVKGICLGLPTPPRIIGLPTLSVTAAPWLTLAGQQQPQALVCAFIQAGRSRHNWAFFTGGDLMHRPGAAEHAGGTATEFAGCLAALAPQIVWLAGELDGILAETVAELPHVIVVDAVSALRRAGQLARLAALHFAQGVQDDLSALQPLYLGSP